MPSVVRADCDVLELNLELQETQRELRRVQNMIGVYKQLLNEVAARVATQPDTDLLVWFFTELARLESMESMEDRDANYH
jgi:hypothetical protein